jgi:alanyl-tRNA synthetase
VFPELRVDPQTVKEVIDDEESQFLLTLVRGEKLFNKKIKEIPAGDKLFPGDVAWRLYDTYGFPIDLTQLMAEEHGLQVNLEEYEVEKEKSVGVILLYLAQYFILAYCIYCWHWKVQRSVGYQCSLD